MQTPKLSFIHCFQEILYEKITNIERVSAHILARPAAFWSSVGDFCWCRGC